MNKIKWTETKNQVDVLEENGQKIEINRYMSFSVQKMLIESFLSIYFDNNDRDYLSAEYANIVAVLDLQTNLDVEDDFDVNLFVASGLWDKVIHSIDNYPQYKEALKDMLEARKAKQDNVAYVVDAFLGQITPMLQNISNIDFSDEKINQIKDLIVNFRTELNDTPVGAIIKESEKI